MGNPIWKKGEEKEKEGELKGNGRKRRRFLSREQI